MTTWEHIIAQQQLLQQIPGYASLVHLIPPDEEAPEEQIYLDLGAGLLQESEDDRTRVTVTWTALVTASKAQMLNDMLTMQQAMYDALKAAACQSVQKADIVQREAGAGTMPVSITARFISQED